jgi:transposase
MLASLIVAKAVDGMPLQRSRKVYKRAGADLPVRTLNRWELLGHGLLSPLIRRIERMVLSSDLITLDDTHLTARDPSATGGTQSGHLWVYVGHSFDPGGDLSQTRRYILYKYAPTWAAEYPEKFLFGCQAILQGDAYRGYDRIVSPNRGDCIGKLLAGCSMHARRPFKQALDIQDPLAPFFVHTYQAIYQVEAEAKERSLTASERLELRHEKSLPLMASIKTRAQELSGLPLNQPIQQGVTYFLNQWERLIVPFRDDGRLEIDNGESERRLRRVAQGRKAWLFAGSEAGAQRFAGDLSVVATAEAAGLEPGDYIQRILPIISDWPNQRIDELLPPNWRIERDAFLAEERAREASAE